VAEHGDRFKHESLQDGESICSYLEALCQGFRAGVLSFASEDQNLALHPTGLLKLEVEAKRKREEVKLILKFRWNEVEQESETNPALSISAGDQ